MGGVGTVVWYQLTVPDGTSHNLPDLTALEQALTVACLDLADLHEVELSLSAGTATT